MRTSHLTRVAAIWLVIWALLALVAFIAAAWGTWQFAADYSPDTYPNERFLRASAAWPMVAALSVIVAFPLSAITFLLEGRARLFLVLFMAVGIGLVGLAAGGMFINVGEPGPGSPSNL